MLFLMLLCGAILFFILCCYALIMRKRLSHPLLLGICIVSFSVSLLIPYRYVLCNSFLKEQISITALREKSDASFGTDVAIQFIESNFTDRSIDNPAEGKWAWWNGTYAWSEEWEKQGLHTTDTIVMEVPVGYDRYITFSTGPICGKAEIACLGDSELGGLLRIPLPASFHDVYEKDMLLRGAALAVAEIFILLAVTLIAVFLNRKTNWRVLLKWKYEALVFLLSLVNIVMMEWYPRVVEYPITYYFMPYESGFNSRGFTGEIALLLGGPYLNQKELALFIFWLLILTYLFASILIVRLAKRESDWWMGVFWVLFYLMTPFSFLQIFDDARPDIYLIILFVAGAILINKNRFVQLVPVICVTMLLINETSSVFFAAPLLAMLLYCFYKERDIGYLISFISSAAFTCITTLGILRLDKGKLLSVDSFFAHMSMHTNIQLNYIPFLAEHKDSSFVINDFAYEMGNQSFPNHELLVNSILYFILLIPFVILLAIIWKAVYKKLIISYEDKRTLLCVKLLYWILLLSSCGGVICMLMAYDYLRFTEFIMIAMLANIFTMTRKENLALRINDLYLFTPPKQNVPMVPFAIILYMGFWGVINVWPRDTLLLLHLEEILRDFFGVR